MHFDKEGPPDKVDVVDKRIDEKPLIDTESTALGGDYHWLVSGSPGRGIDPPQ